MRPSTSSRTEVWNVSADVPRRSVVEVAPSVSPEDGSDNIVIDDFEFDDVGADPWSGTDGEDSAISSIAEVDGDIHHLFSGGGTDGVDQDLYYTKSTDNGDNWDTPTEEIDAITVNFISANIYVRSGNNKLAYVYDDAGVQKYNEKDLGVAAGGGAISAILAIVLASVPDLKGKGKLDATPEAEFSVVANLLAAGGAINATLPIVFDVTADLKADGKLDAVLPLVSAVPLAFLRVKCDQELPPDAILIQTNLSGVVADIDEPVDTPDANWLELT